MKIRSSRQQNFHLFSKKLIFIHNNIKKIFNPMYNGSTMHNHYLSIKATTTTQLIY